MGAADPEAAYYQTIEEFFVAKRGDPLFLSNADWLLVRQWRKKELPLRVVLRGIADALDAHAHSLSRHRKVGSLAYCANEVDAAADRWRRALDLGGDAAPDVGRGLRRLQDVLSQGRGLGASSSEVAARAAAALGHLRDSPLSEVEAHLAACEAELVAAIAKEDGAEVAAKVAGEVEALLAPYRGRMPARVLDQIREDSRVRRLLERHGLPRLSLFHLEADVDADDGGGPR